MLSGVHCKVRGSGTHMKLDMANATDASGQLADCWPHTQHEIQIRQECYCLWCSESMLVVTSLLSDCAHWAMIARRALSTAINATSAFAETIDHKDLI